jgi:hypothetical protein
VHIVYQWMWNFKQRLPAGVGILWYIESQFVNDAFTDALALFNQTNKAHLYLMPDKRDKPDKYMRIVAMEPIYHLGEVLYNVEERHNPDMITGLNQLKGIEPNYRTPDDSPDAQEGAWYYLGQHIYAEDAGNGRTGRTTNRGGRSIRRR